MRNSRLTLSGVIATIVWLFGGTRPVQAQNSGMRRLTVLALALAAIIAISQAARAQDDGELAASKAKKVTIHASGTFVFTLDGIPCPLSQSISDQCYSLAGTNSEMATLDCIVVSSTPPVTTKKGTCYTIVNASTEHAHGSEVDITVSVTGEACITTNKKQVSTEKLTSAAYTSIPGSVDTGTGKQSWRVAPTDATSDASPLAGHGITTLTGPVTLP